MRLPVLPRALLFSNNKTPSLRKNRDRQVIGFIIEAAISRESKRGKETKR